jgi:hypothetical protein
MAKQFMSRIKWFYLTNVRRYQMVVVDFGYSKVVLPKDKAFQLIECLESAERYEEKYWPEAKRKEKNMQSDYTYHVYPLDGGFTMTILGDSKYQMAKLAGKPTE